MGESERFVAKKKTYITATDQNLLISLFYKKFHQVIELLTKVKQGKHINKTRINFKMPSKVNPQNISFRSWVTFRFQFFFTSRYVRKRRNRRKKKQVRWIIYARSYKLDIKTYWKIKRYKQEEESAYNTWDLQPFGIWSEILHFLILISNNSFSYIKNLINHFFIYLFILYSCEQLTAENKILFQNQVRETSYI